MADWSQPRLSSNYADFLSELVSRDEDSAKMFDGSTASNIPSGAIKWNSSQSRFEAYENVTSGWGLLTEKLAMNVDQVDGCDVDNNTINSTSLWTSEKLIAAFAPRSDSGSSSTIYAETFVEDGTNLENKYLGINDGVEQLVNMDGSNTSVGNSLVNLSTGYHNTAFGQEAGLALTTGYKNTAIGYKALTVPLSASGNTAVGHNALRYTTYGDSNTAIGNTALERNTSGEGNTAVGVGAGYFSTSANYNTAVGYGALYYVQTGGYNTAVGNDALSRLTTAVYNTAVGTKAGLSITTGDNNTMIGYQAGYNATSGYNNTIVGVDAAEGLSTGYNNTALGYRAAHTGSTGSNNTSLGYLANSALTTGFANTAVGSAALENVTIGYGNAALGRSAGNSVTSGDYNVAVGTDALEAVNTGNRNIGIGYGAADTVTSGNDNIALGYASMAANTSGNGNVGIGRGALSDTTGSYNVAIGYLAGYPTGAHARSTAIGYGSRFSSSDQITLGDSNATVYLGSGTQVTSDKRDKADIRDTILGLDFINQLRPVDYRWDSRQAYLETVVDGAEVTTVQHPIDGSKKRVRFHHGLIAQEVDAVIKESGVDFGGYQDHSVNGGDDQLSLGYTEFIAPLIKAVQELTTRVNELEAE